MSTKTEAPDYTGDSLFLELVEIPNLNILHDVLTGVHSLKLLLYLVFVCNIQYPVCI